MGSLAGAERAEAGAYRMFSGPDRYPGDTPETERNIRTPPPPPLGIRLGWTMQRLVNSLCFPVQIDTGIDLQPASYTTCSRPSSAVGS
jgi:hypothetical protein